MRLWTGGLSRWLWLALPVAVLAALLGLGRSPGAVNWSEVRAVALQSDDWGLCGFVPDSTALHGIDRQQLQAGHFPQVYWGSTLEDSAAVASLQRILAAHLGRDGLPPILQANYIVSSLHYRASEGEGLASSWDRYDIPALPPDYERPGLWRAVAEAIASGVWRPELHGAFHYDPLMRREAVRTSEAARMAAARGVLLFPGSGRAWELGPWRDDQTLTSELKRSLAIFTQAFGRRPLSVVAPDYVWDGRCERIWSHEGLRVIQGKREQRQPWRRWRGTDRLLKVLERTLARLRHTDRVYLERNARLEAVQGGSWQQAAASCLAEITKAWRRGEPAIVETHRINYAHTDAAVAESGRRALEHLLQSLGTQPIYVTDEELAQLQRTGTSCSVRGNQTIVRNLTHGRRLVAVPTRGEGSAAGGGDTMLVSVPPQTIRILRSDCQEKRSARTP